MSKNVMVQNRVDLANAELKAGFKKRDRRLVLSVAALATWGCFFIDMLTHKSSIWPYGPYGYAVIALWSTLAVIFWEKYTDFEYWFWRD